MKVEVKELVGHKDKIECCIILDSALREVASAGDDEEINIWNFEKGERLQTLTGHISKVCSIAAGLDKERMISGGEDKLVIVWRK